MRPKQLIISGWGPYKEVCTIDFEAFEGKGLFLITGATGAGKTTIFDAICFALYGAMSGETREKNSVRSDFALEDTKTYVELVMEHGGKRYRIYRNPEYERLKKRKTGNSSFTKEKENAILYLPDGKVIEGSNEVTKRIQELLALNVKQFKQISMIAQGEFSRLLAAPSKEKLEIFRGIFGTGIYEELANILKQRSKKLYQEATGIKQRLDEAVQLLKLPDEEFVRLTDTKDLNYEAIRVYLKKAEKVYRKKVQEADKGFERADKESTELAANMSLLKERSRQLIKNEEQLTLATEQLHFLYQEKENLTGTFQNREKISEALRLKENCQSYEEQEDMQRKQIEKLKEELLGFQEKYLLQEEVCRRKRCDYEEAELSYKRAAAGIAARLLVEGQPCPVCGSTTHPAPASVSEDIPDEKKLKRLKQEAVEAEKNLQDMWSGVVDKRARCETLEKQNGELKSQWKKEKERLAGYQEFLEAFDKMPVRTANQKLQEMTERYQKLEGLILEKEAACSRLKKEIQESREGQEHTLEGYKEELCRLTEQQGRLTEQKELFLQEQKIQNSYLTSITYTGQAMKEKLQKLQKVSEEYGYVKDLDNAANGMNPKKLVFEQYVLAAYFEEILRAANVRLMKMTADRYEMSRPDKVTDGRSRDNLEIQVLDYYTGKVRSVKTLSGGESFKASLCLALGMSDVIQAFHGGIRVDTLFVDEGFGSLDSESLDQACETLSSLVEKDRLIGIISHVPELRERIDNQLLVEKTNSGSSIRCVL